MAAALHQHRSAPRHHHHLVRRQRRLRRPRPPEGGREAGAAGLRRGHSPAAGTQPQHEGHGEADKSGINWRSTSAYFVLRRGHHRRSCRRRGSAPCPPPQTHGEEAVCRQRADVRQSGGGVCRRRHPPLGRRISTPRCEAKGKCPVADD